MKPSFSFALAIAAGMAVASVWLSGVAPPAQAQAGQPAACPDRLVAGQSSLVCACSSEATASGSVWGSDVYTDDSAICRAALHAGAIGTGGGIVWVREEGGRESYPAVTRNSVASSAWGQWTRSIAFRPAVEAVDPAKMVQACPANAAGLDVGTSLSCGCAASAMASGTVWGSGPYTADSAICRAARHAGAVGPDGGMVSIRVSAGRASYAASSRNGVDAAAWGAFSRSFEFDR
jgi:hypothetical protein